MNSTRKDNPYNILLQNGPFATGEEPPNSKLFSAETRNWCRNLRKHNNTTTFRVIRNQILELLSINSLAEVKTLFADHTRQPAIKRAYLLLANMFGINGNERETASRINSFSSTADEVIRSLQGKVFANYASYIEMTNEIDACRCPVQLLLAIFDHRYHRKARFEAKRKLILMQLAAAIDQRERETDMESKFSRFLDFLNDHVWSPDLKIGELETSFLLSEHNAKDFSCRSVKVINRKEAQQFKWEPGRKLTLVKRRRFRTSDGMEIPIYVTVRKKTEAAKVLKLIRKGEENPAVAVDDELGLMGVVDSMQEVKLFHNHLSKSAARAGTLLTLEEVSDNLNGAGHKSASPGSSSQTPMCKFFARMGGMRVEFILHTNKSYLDYRYKLDVSHDEYEAKRIFDSGVAELLFPPDIYHLDLQNKRRDVLKMMRRNIEES